MVRGGFEVESATRWQIRIWQIIKGGQTMARKDYSKQPMFDDPDPTDENTSPEFLEECYQMYQARGYKPEDLTDLKERKAYRKWLEKQ